MSDTAKQSEALSVAIQSRDRMFREAIAAQVDREPDLRVVGTTTHGAELFRLCELRDPRVIVFETADADPVELVTELRARHRRLHLVGLYDNPNPEIAERMHVAGVSRLVSHSGGLETLLAAVRRPVWSDAPGEQRARRNGTVVTDREVRILHLISAGYTLEQIATALDMTPRAVENHKRRIFAKLDVQSQAHAAANAARLGLLRAGEEPGSRADAGPMPGHEPVGLLCGRPGPLADEVARLLLSDGIALIVDRSSAPNSTRHPARHARGTLIAVLIDPQPADWSTALDLACRIIVVLSDSPEQAVMVNDVLRGANALITAADLTDTLVPVFHLVADGYLLVNAEQARKFISAGYTRLARMRPFVPLELTPRERQILSSIDRGHSVKQTARVLGISVKTVESLQSRLFRKLGIRSRGEALVVAYGLGLVPLAEEPAGPPHRVTPGSPPSTKGILPLLRES